MLALHTTASQADDFSYHSEGSNRGCKRFLLDGYLSCTSTLLNCSRGHHLDVTLTNTEIRTFVGKATPFLVKHACN